MNKKTYPYHLTAAEESVLDILWNLSLIHI